MSSLTLRSQVDTQLAQQRARGHWLLRFLGQATGALFSFETLFILYVWSGMYKSDPHLKWIPGDLTAILFFVSVAAGTLVLLRQGIRIRPAALNFLWLILAMSAWLFITTLWSPSQDYATRKALYFPTLTLWAVFAGAFIIARSEQRLRRFYAMLLAFALFITASAFVALRAGLHSNVRVLIRALGSHYGTLGVMVGTAVVLLVLYSIYKAKTWWQRAAIYGFTVAIMGMLLFMGSRTSLVFPILASMIPVSQNLRWPRTPGKLLLWMGAGVLLVIAGVALWSRLLTLVPGGPTTLKRFQTLEKRGAESEGRVRNLELAKDIINHSSIPELVFGHGIGSWPILIGNPDQQNYPHNLSVEILIELGLVGLTLFWGMALLSVTNLGSLRSIRGDPLRMFLLTVFFSQLIIAHVSGDLHENRGLFVMMSLMTFDWRGVRKDTTVGTQLAASANPVDPLRTQQAASLQG